MTNFLVVEEMACPKCKGTGTLCTTRTLDSLWDELGDLLTAIQAQQLAHCIRDTNENDPVTPEYLLLADTLEKRFP